MPQLMDGGYRAISVETERPSSEINAIFFKSVGIGQRQSRPGCKHWHYIPFLPSEYLGTSWYPMWLILLWYPNHDQVSCRYKWTHVVLCHWLPYHLDPSGPGTIECLQRHHFHLNNDFDVVVRHWSILRHFLPDHLKYFHCRCCGWCVQQLGWWGWSLGE